MISPEPVMVPLSDLWQEHRARLRGYIARRVREDDAVDDILQEVFLKAQGGLSGVRSSGSLTAWLYRIAANAIADHYRALRPWESLPEDLAAPEPGFEAAAELAECVRPLIAGLPEVYRTALVLSDLDGLPQKAVAERLGLSLSATKSRVQRGRERLRRELLACCDIETGRAGIVGYEPRRPGPGDGGGCGG
jgi:RNA polymerase sigma-70 factor, ECF subfamily